MQEYYIGFAGNKQDITTEDLVKQYQITKNEECLEEIIRRNKGLIIKWANSYLNIPNSEIEDLVSEGYIAMLRALRDYDPARGYAFTTCLKGYVIQHFNKLYNRATRNKRNSLLKVESYEEMVELHTDQFTATTEDYSSLELDEYIQSLHDRQRAIVCYLLAGLTKTEIANELHITCATVTYHIKTIRKSYVAFNGVA